ncbi:hypothetical protein Ciccas_006096 [Cichlidogyrus casuarinus]|uniref:BHLH domain-containing protein n=1 Tax=Cichlidogyrus casuarinus TaxID=1844966 RepID=A0ABD2Q6S7_9PLAT
MKVSAERNRRHQFNTHLENIRVQLNQNSTRTRIDLIELANDTLHLPEYRYLIDQVLLTSYPNLRNSPAIHPPSSKHMSKRAGLPIQAYFSETKVSAACYRNDGPVQATEFLSFFELLRFLVPDVEILKMTSICLGRINDLKRRSCINGTDRLQFKMVNRIPLARMDHTQTPNRQQDPMNIFWASPSKKLMAKSNPPPQILSRAAQLRYSKTVFWRPWE